MADTALIDDGIYYPDSDGQPVADNDTNRIFMDLLLGALRRHYAGQEVYVSSDLFWYPVKGRPDIVQAPDILVAFGRPAGRRRSYRQWREGDLAPQLVIEVISPKNTHSEMSRKRDWYERYGVEEYIEIDPDEHRIEVWRRVGTRLVPQHDERRSRLLDISFEPEGDDVIALWPDGSRLLSYDEYAQLAESESERAARESERAARESERAAREAERATREAERADRLAARLRALGLDPDDVGEADDAG